MRCAGIVFAVMLAFGPAARGAITLHSDVPLDPGNHVLWPQGCSTGQILAMCSRFSLGMWKEHFRNCASTEASGDCLSWIRLEIASVIDGGYAFSESETRNGAPIQQDIAAIVELSPKTDPIGLYAIQIGYNTGSRYVLVSARHDGLRIDRASVLDVRCPKGWAGVQHREGPAGLYITEYCSISSLDVLTRLARDALNRPPLATLDYDGPGVGAP